MTSEPAARAAERSGVRIISADKKFMLALWKWITQYPRATEGTITILDKDGMDDRPCAICSRHASDMLGESHCLACDCDEFAAALAAKDAEIASLRAEVEMLKGFLANGARLESGAQGGEG